MSPKPLPSRPSLEQYKKQAKDLVKAHQSADPAALQRIKEFHPRLGKLPDIEIRNATFALADAQFVIAIEHGFESWPKFKLHLDSVARGADPNITAFLEAACAGNQIEAERFLRAQPELASASIFTAAMLGATEIVESLLKREPSLAKKKGGPKNGEPLLYLSFSRFHRADPKRAQGILRSAKLLLAHGADPNTYYLWEGDGKNKLPALWAATCQANYPALARVLLEAGAEPNDDESLYHSCEQPDHQCLRLLLESGVKKRWINYCLFHQLDREDMEGLQLFLQHGADPWVADGGVPGEFGMTALHWAVRNGRSQEIINHLLDHGAAIDAESKDGLTAYNLALRLGNQPMAELLLQRGAQKTLLNEKDEFLAACACADASSVTSRLATQPNIVASLTPADKRIIADAARLKHHEAIRIMLQAGVSPDARDDQELTPLHWAAWYGQIGTVKLLLAHQAPLEATEKYHNSTPLGWACYASQNHPEPNGDYPAVVEALLAAGATLPEGTTGSDAVSEVLSRQRAAKADPSSTQTNDEYFEAVRRVDVETIRRLLEQHPSLVHARIVGDTRLLGVIWTRENSHTPLPPDDLRNSTALHFAAYYGHAELARVLLEYGADPNARGYDNNRGDSCAPLELAAWEGGIEVLRVLLEHGADPNVNDSAALYTAARHGARDRCELLLASGARPNLLTAARLGLVDRLKELLSSNIPRETVNLAMEEAVQDGHRGTAEFLVSRGAQLTLTHAAGLGMLDKVKESVADNPASVNPTDGSETPLMAAARQDHVEVVRYLLDHGANVHLAQNESVHRVQPIHVAKTASAELLIHAGADVNAPYRGFTPLQRAVSRGDSKLAETLARLGGTKCFYLVGRLDAKLIEPLIGLGSDVNETDKDGKSALDYALDNQQKTAAEAPATSRRFADLAQLLRQHGAKTAAEQPSPRGDLD